MYEYKYRGIPNGVPEMGTIVKKETYTATQPDGTVVTTTTTSTTQQDAYVMETNYGPLHFTHLMSPVGILRVLEIIVGFIIVGCVTGPMGGGGAYIGLLGGQTYVLVVAALCVVTTFVFLVIYLLGLYQTLFQDIPLRIIDFGYNVCAVVLYLFACGVEIWYASGIWQPNCNEDIVNVQRQPCLIIVGWIVAAVFCVVNTILYIISAWMANQAKYYL